MGTFVALGSVWVVSFSALGMLESLVTSHSIYMLKGLTLISIAMSLLLNIKYILLPTCHLHLDLSQSPKYKYQVSKSTSPNPFVSKVLPTSVNVNSILAVGALWSSLLPIFSPLVTALHPTASFLDLQTPTHVFALGLVCSVPSI